MILCRYKEGRYPENMEKILIKNASLGTTEVNFYFQHDYNAATFLLDPPNMTLEQGEEKVVFLFCLGCLYTCIGTCV